MSDRHDLNTATLNNLKQFGGDNLVNKVAKTYLDNAPPLVHLIGDAYRKGDFETLRKTAHSLKSSTAPVGAEVLYDLVKKIEMFATDGDSDTLADLVPQVEPAFLRTKELIESMD